MKTPQVPALKGMTPLGIPATLPFTYLLAQRFGPEWDALSPMQQSLVGKDFALVLLEDYDVPDPTMAQDIQEENALDCSREYRRNIGGGNLAAHVKRLENGTKLNASGVCPTCGRDYFGIIDVDKYCNNPDCAAVKRSK